MRRERTTSQKTRRRYFLAHIFRNFISTTNVAVFGVARGRCAARGRSAALCARVTQRAKETGFLDDFCDSQFRARGARGAARETDAGRARMRLPGARGATLRFSRRKCKNLLAVFL